MRQLVLLLSLSVLVACVQEQEPPRPPNLCDDLRDRCGGLDAANWYAWCQSECVPEHARTVPCGANAECVLCDAPRADANTTLFALPTDELEYLWTLTDRPREPLHPDTEPAPTGGGFVDDLRSLSGEGTVGAWRAYAPYADPDPLTAGGFCEPGPNRFLDTNVLATAGALVLRAEHMPEQVGAPYCLGGRCGVGPYPACDAPTSACQYREDADALGLGTGSQADRVGPGGEESTLGYGRFRAVLAASGDAVPPASGFVYAFFTQGNRACVDGAPNVETNTSELDVEISSGLGDAGGERFCVSGEMCLQVSTWVSSDQGIASGGVLRHQVSGFRFRTPELAGRYRTYGWDWQENDVRFVYDADPHDCDESTGTCDAQRGALAICRHTRFIPRRPAPLHLQLWNAWWAGDSPRGTEAIMSVERVWHTPSE